MGLTLGDGLVEACRLKSQSCDGVENQIGELFEARARNLAGVVLLWGFRDD